MQARIKQLTGKSNFSQEYIEVLPPAPSDFCRAHRATALAVFSADQPPVRCPLQNMQISLARSKIIMRGGSLMRNSLHVVSEKSGYNRPSRMYARTYMQQHCAVYVHQDLARTLTRTRWQTHKQ